MKRRIFYPQHHVTSIQLLNSGEIIIAAQRVQKSVRSIDRVGNPVIGESVQNVQFRAKGVIISNGCSQSLPSDFYDKRYPFLISRRDRVILSDDFLRKRGYLNTMKTINENKYRNIVIVGGSHSGFSVAWLMLNGPATYNQNNSLGQRSAHFKLPDHLPRANPNCKQCCHCGSNNVKANKDKEIKCVCVCKCFGFFQHNDWGFDPKIHQPHHFKGGNITIIYRDKIRVFYKTAQKALQDGYQDFNQHALEGRYVYPYSGLRGDAKALYKNIKSGAEKRITLVRAAHPELQAEYMQKADIVVWACGYQTNKIPIKDQEGREIYLSQQNALMQYDIDSNSKLLTSNGGLLNKVFGAGFGYPPVTKDGIQRQNNQNLRANSFTLYRGGIASRIFRNILPKSNLDQKIQFCLTESSQLRQALLSKDKSVIIRRSSQTNPQQSNLPQNTQSQANLKGPKSFSNTQNNLLQAASSATP